MGETRGVDDHPWAFMELLKLRGSSWSTWGSPTVLDTVSSPLFPSWSPSVESSLCTAALLKEPAAAEVDTQEDETGDSDFVDSNGGVAFDENNCPAPPASLLSEVLTPPSPRDGAQFFTTDTEAPTGSLSMEKKFPLLTGPASSSSLSLSYPVRALKALWCFWEGRLASVAVVVEEGWDDAGTGLREALLGVGRLVSV